MAADGLVMTIPPGADQTREALKLMRRMVRESKRTPEIRELAVTLTNDLPNRARRAEVARCFDFVQQTIRYTGDVTDVETLQLPADTLRLGAGDCDDMAMLLASLLEAIGHDTRFSALAFIKDPAGRYCYGHVITETPWGHYADNRIEWLSMDPTVDQPMGWRPPAIQILHTLQIYNGSDRLGRDCA